MFVLAAAPKITSPEFIQHGLASQNAPFVNEQQSLVREDDDPRSGESAPGISSTFSPAAKSGSASSSLNLSRQTSAGRRSALAPESPQADRTPQGSPTKILSAPSPRPCLCGYVGVRGVTRSRPSQLAGRSLPGWPRSRLASVGCPERATAAAPGRVPAVPGVARGSLGRRAGLGSDHRNGGVPMAGSDSILTGRTIGIAKSQQPGSAERHRSHDDRILREEWSGRSQSGRALRRLRAREAGGVLQTSGSRKAHGTASGLWRFPGGSLGSDG